MRKARVSRWWSKHNLPEELWAEILSRLPVKSLLRFRCVSRSWKNCIDDPDFARLHLTRFNNRPNSPIFFVQSGPSLQCVVKNSETLKTISTLGFLQTNRESPHVLRSTDSRQSLDVSRWLVVSSLDGLFLLRSALSRPHLMLWNPSLRKTLPLPPVPVLDSQTNQNVYGLGFDPSTKDYSVVGFSFGKGQRFAQAYTLKTNSWKLITSHGHYHLDGFVLSPISFNGALYVLTFSRTLGSFDLKSEVYASFELPHLPVTDRKATKCKLLILDEGSSLALVHLYTLKGSIWTLESVGDDTNARSWIQRYTFDVISPRGITYCEFLCMKNNGEMLMSWFPFCKVVCYNLETHHLKILMRKNRKNFQVDSTTPYKESLILLS